MRAGLRSASLYLGVVECKTAGRTLGHVGQLVLAHSLECCALHLALELWWDAEEEDGETNDSDDASDGSEEGCGSHCKVCGSAGLKLCNCVSTQEEQRRRRNEFIV